jgi:hypothetical protein
MVPEGSKYYGGRTEAEFLAEIAEIAKGNF